MEGRRGLTMIELLLVIAVLMAIAALAFPALQGRVEGARIDSAVAEVEAAVASGRAKARESGKPVEVRLLEADAAAPVQDKKSGERDAPVAAVNVRLPSGLHVGAADHLAGDSNKATPKPKGAGDGSAEPSSLAVCLPDGTVDAPAPAALVSGDRTLDLTVNRWTGAVHIAERKKAGDSSATDDQKPSAAKAGAP